MEILHSNDKTLKMATSKAKQGYLGMARIESSETRRVTLKIRTSEGSSGILQILVIPHGNLISVGLEVPLKSLNLHQRISSIDTVTTLPFSHIKISGKFDTSEALTWIANSIPDVP